MKPNTMIRIVPFLLVATAAFADNEPPKKEVQIRRHLEKGGPGGWDRKMGPDDGRMEKENVAFLGVETLPVSRTISAQLGLPRDTGLVVRRVAEGSPASNLLKEHDVLTKLDDQILVNMQQLSVLVRSKKAGDEIKLTYLRGGKETSVKATLSEHEVPKLAGDFPPPEAGNMFFRREGLPPDFPALAGPEAGDMMRLIGGDRMHWFTRPRVHMFRHPGEKGSTLLDLPAGSFVFSDDQGTVELSSANEKRELTIKNSKGEVTFQGPLNTPDDHAKLPPEVTARLEVIGGANLSDDDDSIEVENKVLAQPNKTGQSMPAAPLERGFRTL